MLFFCMFVNFASTTSLVEWFWHGDCYIELYLYTLYKHTLTSSL